MNKQIKSKAVCRLLTVGIGMGVFAHIDDAFAELSEIDVFEQAIAAGTKEGVLDFVRAFPSSHLVTDLFELLPPDLAAEVCSDLPSGVSSAGRRACNRLQEAVALAPAAGGSASEESAESDSTIRIGTTAPSTSAIGAESKRSGDKQQFLMAGPTNDTSTDASISARRDGVAADDTADDTTGGSTGSTATDATDTNAEDTADAAPEATGPVAGSFNEDGGSISATPGGDKSDGGTGGSTDGGAEKGGRR